MLTPLSSAINQSLHLLWSPTNFIWSAFNLALKEDRQSYKEDWWKQSNYKRKQISSLALKIKKTSKEDDRWHGAIVKEGKINMFGFDSLKKMIKEIDWKNRAMSGRKNFLWIIKKKKINI